MHRDLELIVSKTTVVKLVRYACSGCLGILMICGSYQEVMSAAKKTPAIVGFEACWVVQSSCMRNGKVEAYTSANCKTAVSALLGHRQISITTGYLMLQT